MTAFELGEMMPSPLRLTHIIQAETFTRVLVDQRRRYFRSTCDELQHFQRIYHILLSGEALEPKGSQY